MGPRKYARSFGTLPYRLSSRASRIRPEILGAPVTEPYGGPRPRGFPDDAAWVEKKFVLPEPACVFRIERGFADHNGFVFTEDFLPLPRAFHPRRHTARGLLTANTADIECSYLKRPTHIPSCKGRVVSLSSLHHDNYFHWILEILGRYRLAEENFDKPAYFYTQHKRKFQRDSLQTLGVDPERIISTDDHPIIEAENLIVPLYHQYPARHYDRDHLEWLRTHFAPPAAAPEEPPLRIFVSRAHAPRRKLRNEPELLGLLAKHGFTIVNLEDAGFAEQISMFARAEAVIAPHGAALANLAFAPAGCKVIELFPNVLNDSLHRLTGDIGGHYTFIRAGGSGSRETLHDDFTVPEDVLLAALEFHSL